MKKFFFTLLILPLAIALADDRAPVGVRTLSSEAINETAEEEQIPPAEETLSEEAAGCCWGWNHVNYYPVSNHWIFAISAFNDSLGLEDGSIWQIDNYRSDCICDWLINDPIAITQNHAWLSHYKYRIFNKNLGTSIPATLSEGPFLSGAYSRYIVNLDHYRGMVILSDNSRWLISFLDTSILNEWALNDYIIIGINTGCDAKSPYILINSNMDNCIRAKQF